MDLRKWLKRDSNNNRKNELCNRKNELSNTDTEQPKRPKLGNTEEQTEKSHNSTSSEECKSAEEVEVVKKKLDNTEQTDKSHNSTRIDECNSTATKVEVVKKKYKFQHNWTKKWPWLRNEEDKGMLCELCIKHKKNNPFFTGCKNFRTSTLERHVTSADHQLAVKEESMSRQFSSVTKKAVERSAADPAITTAMRTAYWMAKEDLAINKYPSLMNLLKVQGCEALARINTAKNATYNSRVSGEDFQKCIADVIQKDILTAVKKAEFYSVLIDESTDISISKQMVVYVRIVNELFEPKTFFLEDICIEDPKSDARVLFDHLVQCLESKGLDLSKCLGFGSDGASVMTGRRSGVATRVKERSPHCVSIHCMAHRLNLCSSQASRDVPYYKTFEKTCSDLFYYFGGSKSGNRKCELEEIQKILNDPKVKIKECHEIRWLSFCEAITSIYKTWKSLVVFFERHQDSKSKLLFTNLTDYRFLVVLHLLLDILPHIAQVSLLLQKQDIDVAAVNPALTNLRNKITAAEKGSSSFQKELKEKLEQKKDKKGSIKELKYKGVKLDFGRDLLKLTTEMNESKCSFCSNLKRNINSRFPQESLDVSMAFGILGLRPISFLSDEDLDTFGQKELEILTNHYGKDQTINNVVSNKIVESDKCFLEWSILKTLVIDQKYPRDKLSGLWKLIFMYHKDSIPNLIKLANMALIMPYQTADCERGFSCQNSIKSSKRNRIKADRLNTLMTIKIQGGSLEEFDCSRVVDLWRDKKMRRIDSTTVQQ